MANDVYGEALATMGAEPLEEHEPVVTLTGRGGQRPGAGRKRLPAGQKRVKLDVRLDPDLHRHVAAYATANGFTFSQAVNVLLAEAMKDVH